MQSPGSWTRVPISGKTCSECYVRATESQVKSLYKLIVVDAILIIVHPSSESDRICSKTQGGYAGSRVYSSRRYGPGSTKH